MLFRSRGETDGVFQLESDGMRRVLRGLKPSCFEDIIALLALYRPGPLESGMVDDFIGRKHGLRALRPNWRKTQGLSRRRLTSNEPRPNWRKPRRSPPAACSEW